MRIRFYLDPESGLPHIHSLGVSEERPMKKSRFPRGWNEQRVQRVLRHYEAQSESEAMAENVAAYKNRKQTVMTVPVELVPKVRQMIARRRGARKAN